MESSLRAGAGQPGLKLIETMRLEPAGIARLAHHRARMARSAGALGWSFDPAAFDRALARATPTGGARLRLTLEASGAFDLTQADLPESRPLWRLGLASARLSSTDPWLGHKTTNRAAYDQARATLPQGLDEVIFQNERDEVCDGSITTLFFDRGQGLRTPPLSAGLLPGVLRAELACPEEPLPARDLPHVRLWVGNSLRGLIPAVWAG